MGMVIYRRVTNVYDIPLDILVDTIGKGLTINRTGELPLLEPAISNGLEFKEDGTVGIKTGDGIRINECGELVIDIICNECDTVVDPCKSTEFSVQIDSSLSLDAQKLSLVKKYQKYTVQRNTAGVILDIIPGEITEKTDEVLICAAYGYGYGSGQTKTYRPTTPEMPNFYK